ncbi:DUF2948 family protein [Rhodobacteraceae bacterium]|nr:DUF2948 family protein [Paracoccaceae bacterium]
MSEDARFEDGVEASLRLRAEDTEDLTVLAALVQDAVLPASEMTWKKSKRRFACLINRFRWEDKVVSDRLGRPPERVQSLLVIDDVFALKQQGLAGEDMSDAVLSLLTMTFEPGEDGTGRMILTLAGDGAIAADVEAINVTLQDVTRPYQAPSKKTPSHPE